MENLNDYPDLPEVAETGMTFEENARLKAETISQLTGKNGFGRCTQVSKSMSLVACQVSGQLVSQEWELLTVKTMPNSCTNWPWSLNSGSLCSIPHDPSCSKSKQGKFGC